MNNSHRTFILIALTSTAMLLSACGVDNSATYVVQPCGSPTPTQQKLVASRSSNSKLLKQAFASNRTLMQYHIEYISHDSEGEITLSGEVDALNKRSFLYVTIKDGSFYIITIGIDDYISEDNISYTKLDASAAEGKKTVGYVSDVLNSFGDDYIDSIAAALDKGAASNEQLDNMSVKHIVEDPKAIPVENGKPAGEEEFWVTNYDPPTLLQLKMVVNSKQGGGPYDIMITWSKLNQCINIQSPNLVMEDGGTTMPDQPNDRNQPPRPPRKRDEDVTPRPPRRSEDAPPHPPRRSEDAPNRPPRRDAGGAIRPPRAGAGKPARPSAGQPFHPGFRHKREPRPTARLANEGALYEHYHMDPQWETIQQAAQRTLVLISRLLLEHIAAAGWQVVANRRTDAPAYLFGFDNTWTLRNPDGSRTVAFSPEQSYRDLLYLATSYQTNPGEPELDRQAINSFAALEQKAALIARRRVNELTAES